MTNNFMITKPFWIKKRDNPQLGTYYVAMGQLSKTAAKDHAKALYGDNTMLRFETEAEYMAKLDDLRKNGESIQ